MYSTLSIFFYFEKKNNFSVGNEVLEPDVLYVMKLSHEAAAFKHADGRKIDGRRVLVDVEKGRSIKGWLPRRLGGGLGGTRRGGPDVNLKHSGREESRLEDRYIDRDREQARSRDRRRRSRSSDRDRERARSRDRRRRSRSRNRHRSDRHKRDRSRDRERNRDRDASAASVKPEVDGDMGEAKRGHRYSDGPARSNYDVCN